MTTFENSDFGRDDDFDPGYLDAVYETYGKMPEAAGEAAVEAHVDQIEAYANDPANHAAAQESRHAIETMDRVAERQRAEERVYYVNYSADLGRLIQEARDSEHSAGEAAKPGLFDFLKSKEVRDASKIARMSERQLIQAESEIGSTLFGPVAKSGRREFFCLNEDTWIWHEEWTGDDGKHGFRTTRYEIRASEIIKSQDGEKRSYVSGPELRNLVTAQRLYFERTMRSVYHRDPATTRKLVDIL